MYAIEFPFNKIIRLRSTAYYRIKNSTTHTFLEMLRKEKMFWSFKIFKKKKKKKKKIVKRSLFSNVAGLQFRISGF